MNTRLASLVSGRSALTVLALAVASTASAQISATIDFEAGSNPFSAGALSTDQAYAGAQSLYLAGGQSAVFDIPTELQGYDVTITMQVFDMGKWIDRSVEGAPRSFHSTSGAEQPANMYGPRWGVSTGDHTAPFSLGAGITQRTYYDATNGYTMESGGDNRFSSSWNTLIHYPSSSRSKFATSGTGGTNDGSGWVPPTGGEGEWTTWTFSVSADGSQTSIQYNALAPYANVNAAKAIGSTPTQVWIYGGGSTSHLAGVYLDDITITAVPEPSTYALMFGAVVLGAAFLRRRKKA